MTNTKLEQLTKAIQSAVPDIMKLEMGCKILIPLKKKKYETIIYVSTFSFYGHDRKQLYTDERFWMDDDMDRWVDELDGDFENLGRDIQLEDVMIALTLNGGSRFNVITYKRGQMRGKIEILREDQKHFITWTLKSPLHQQEQETIDFLWDLICK